MGISKEIATLVAKRKTELDIREIMRKTRENMKRRKEVKMKSAIQSKTVVFNFLAGAVAILMFVTNLPIVSDPNVKELILAVVAVINIVLRWGGNAPIKKVI